jgi:hypothetical protein
VVLQGHPSAQLQDQVQLGPLINNLKQLHDSFVV